MSTYVRLPAMRRGSTRPLVGTVMNGKTGAPVDLRQPDTSIVFEARIHASDTEPTIKKTYGLEDDIEGITVSDADPGNQYSVDFDREDTIDVAAELLQFVVLVVEPDSEGDSPVYGVLPLISD